MKHVIWKKRIVTVLIFCMLVTQIAVPVSAQNGSVLPQAESVEVPTEYKTLEPETQAIDLESTEAVEEEKSEAANENDVTKALEVYGSIPVIGKEVQDEAAEPEIAPETVAKNAAPVATEEDRVCTTDQVDGVLTLDTVEQVFLSIAGESQYYTFVPEESGQYVLSNWADGNFYYNQVIYWYYDENSAAWYNFNDVNGFASTMQNAATTLELTEGVSYKFEVNSWEQGYMNLCLTKANTVSGNSAEIGRAVVYDLQKGAEAAYVTMSVESTIGWDYRVSVDGETLIKAEDGTYKFWVLGSKKVVIWKTNSESDTVSISKTQTAVSEMELEEGQISWAKTVNQKYDSNAASNTSYVKFSVPETGMYALGVPQGPELRVYEITETGNIYIGMSYGAFFVDLDAQKEYYLKVSGTTSEGNHNLFVQKINEESVSFGEETQLTVSGPFAFIKLPAITSGGVYEIAVKGPADDIYMQQICDNGDMGMLECETEIIYQNNNSVRNVFLNSSSEAAYLRVYTKELTESLANATITVTRKNTSVLPDEGNCAKAEKTLSTADTCWVSFVPAKSGEYVMTTEKKYSNLWTEAYLYKPDENGNIETYVYLKYANSDDNVHVYAELSEGETYYYKLTQNNYGDAVSEQVNIVIYPMESVEYSGTEPVKTSIRKSVDYTMTVDKVGFYKLNISGLDDSYLLNIESEDGSGMNTFVYKDIPRVFQFAQTGTYKISVSKELMGDSADEITFSCSTEGALQIIKSMEYTDITVDNTDGTWLSYTPEESGWYILEMKDSEGTFYSSLSVLSEDGTEILGQSHVTTYYGSEKAYVYYLVAGREYYYNIYSYEESTGEVSVRLSDVAKTVSADDTTLPELNISENEKLLLLKTNFSQEQMIKICTDEIFAESFAEIREVTEGYNDDGTYLDNGSIVKFPAGEREYLLCFRDQGECCISMKKWQEDYEFTSQQQFELTNTSKEQWAKFEPQESGFYSASLTDKDVADISMYVVSGTLMSNSSFTVSRTNTSYLVGGNTYFYKVYCTDDIPEGDSVKTTLKVTQNEINETLGEGDYAVSMNDIYIAPVELEDSVYYDITMDYSQYKGYRISWVLKYSNGRTKLVKNTNLSSDMTRFSLSSSYFKSGRTLYAVITRKDVNGTEHEGSFEFGLHKTQILYEELEMGQTHSQEASNAIKVYTFTPDETGVYSIILTSEDERALEADDYIWIGDGDEIEYDCDAYNQNLAGSSPYEVIYENTHALNAGTTYKFQLQETYAYDLRLAEVNRRYVYDYDRYNAFFASGGTITLETELTEDMWDAMENGYANYVHTGDGKYIYMDATGFKNQSDIWLPDYFERFCIEDGTATYNSIEKACYWWDHYIPKAWYKVDSADYSKSEKVTLSQNVDDETLLLVYREPKNVLIQTIALSGVSAMTVGQTSKITATTSTLNKYEATNPNIVFSSSNSNIVSVDAQGNMTAKAPGKAVIWCKSADGNAEAKLEVSVKQNIIRAVSVTITGAQDIFVEDEIDLTATITTDGNGKPTVDGIDWSSSDTNVATVDQNGHVTGIAPGTVTITAASKDGYAKQTVTITVNPIVEKKIALNESEIRMKKGTKYKYLEVAFTPSNTTDQSLTWKSSNKKVATVSKSGVITAKAVGKATITVTSANGKTDKVKVTVTSSNIKVKKITISKKETLLVGDVLRLKPEIEPVNATNNKVSYESSDTKVATVTNAGVVSAKSPGKATITITAKDGTGKKATCTITVKAPDEPKKPDVESNKKKTATLTWEEVEEADGYIIYMSTSKKGKYKVAATIKGAKTNQYTIKKLKSKKKYYFKIVSYVNVGKNKIYSDETKIVSIKVK